MYRCFFCRGVRPPGLPRLIHAVHRTVRERGKDAQGQPCVTERREIAQELAVCASCQRELVAGVGVAELANRCRPPEPVQPPKPAQGAPSTYVIRKPKPYVAEAVQF